MRPGRIQVVEHATQGHGTNRPPFNVKDRRCHAGCRRVELHGLHGVTPGPGQIKLTPQITQGRECAVGESLQRQAFQQLDLLAGFKVGHDDLAQGRGVQGQPQAGLGCQPQVAPRFFRCNQHNTVTIQHGKLRRFSYSVAQPDQLVLGSEPQIEVAPDFMGQFQQPKAKLVGI